MLSIYKASAGSGKTHTLTREYLLLLFKQYHKHHTHMMPHSRILAVTFTKKATAEMKVRILKALYLLSSNPSKSPFYEDIVKHFRVDDSTLQAQARTLLIAILKDYNHFSVSTIDGFFQQVIRTFAIDLGLSTTYDIAMDGDEVVQQAVDEIFLRIRQQQTDPDVLSWITEFAQHNLDESVSGNLHRSISEFSKQLNKEEVKRHIGQVQAFFEDKKNIKNYQIVLKQIVTDFEQELKAIQQQARPLVENVEEIKSAAISPFTKHYKKVITDGLNSTFIKVLDKPESLCTSETKKKSPLQYHNVISLYENKLQPLYQRMVTLFDKHAKDYHTAVAITKHLYTVGLLQDVALQIETTNREMGRVPMSDVNMLIHDVIDGQEAPFIYERMGQYLHHYMIDEFQDTSSMQWQNFYPLISEAEGKACDNLIVGDVKQSIYRWRNSDWKLLNGVHNEFAGAKLPPMEDNWRTSPIVVKENEQLICQYAQWLTKHLEKDGWNKETPLADMAMSIYDQKAIHQEAQKEYTGLFQLQFFATEKQDLEAKTLEAIDKQLKALKEEGFEWKQIALLVRTGNDAELLAHYLIEKDYPVESAEGMRVQSHPAVQLLVAIMQQHLQPQNEVVQHLINSLHAPFSEKQLSDINKAFTLPLYESVQQLINILELAQQKGALPYLTAFQDQVYQFTQKRVSDLQTFLEYWEKKAEKATIPSSPVVNAVRILTIHSSKGLEFDVVLLPFLNWDIQRTHQGEILWCLPQEVPFNQMPLVAVPLSSNLLNTHFRQEYINEIISQYIDNLNLTYVAFTRPKLRLYAYGQMYSTTQKGSPSISKISHLLSYIYDKVIDTNKSQLLCEDNTYTYRKADTHLCTTSEEEDDKNKESKKEPQTRQANYVSSPINKRLTLRSRAEDDFSEDTPLETIDLGILMHEWLAAINTWHDAPTALERMVAIGRITPTQQSTMQLQLEQLQHLLQREGKEHWFTTVDQILNEHDILSTTGEAQRPDRVMINNNHATIIDYKFGKEHSKQYLKQMRHYIVLYEQMGYTVEAYIVYVAQQKIEQIQ